MASVASTANQRIVFDDHGAGPPLLLIGGRIVSRRGWQVQAPAFAERHRTLVIDNRDAGESERSSADYALRDLANDRVALLAALDIRRPYVPGHSTGSGIAVRLAGEHADVGRIAAPTLVMHGHQDGLIPLAFLSSIS